MENNIVDKLRQFIENEMISCSMDISGITPLNVYRCWGGTVTMEDIQAGLKYIQAEG